MVNRNKVKHSTLLSALKADFKASEQLRSDWDAKVDKWRKEYNGEKYGNEKKGKSQIVSRDIKKQDEWLHPSLLDPFVSSNDIVKVSPVTWEDAQAAKQSELLLNYQFCRQFNRYSFMSKALKVLSQDGTLVVQTGWEYADEEVEVEVPNLVIDETGQLAINGTRTDTELKVLVNKPTAVVCRNEDIFIDPTCMDDMDKCQFVIHRYETDLSTLRADGKYKNLKKVAMTMSESSQDYDFDPEDATEFRFEDEARKKILVHEYWGNYDMNGDGIAEPIVCAWVGNVIIRLESNPYPDQKPPFLVVPFNSVPFQMYGESDAELISDNQKVKTAVTRALIDNMAQSNNGQKGIRKGALDALNRKRFQNGQDFEFSGTPNDFWTGNFNSIPSSAFDMLGLMSNEIESQTGVKSFSGGISGNSLGATATGARGALDATAIRRMNRVRNISENLIKPLMRKWLSYSSEFLTDTEVIRVTNSEFVEINRDDLAGTVDLDINVSTSEDSAAKSQELSFLLQTLGNTVPFEVTTMLMGDLLDLMKMPDKAQKIREFKQQPDPVEEQRKQIALQKEMLEIEKLKAEIAGIYSSAREDDADKAEKMAQARLKAAQARKFESEADLKDLNFLQENEGIKHKQEIEKKEFDRLRALDELAFQAERGDTNLGVSRD